MDRYAEARRLAAIAGITPSDLNLRLLTYGVAGGDGEPGDGGSAPGGSQGDPGAAPPTNPEGEPTTPAEGDPSQGATQPADGGTPTADPPTHEPGTHEGDEDPVAQAPIPDLPPPSEGDGPDTSLSDLDEDTLRARYGELDAAYNARFERGVAGDDQADELELIRLAQARIVTTIETRRAAEAARAERVENLPAAPALPEPSQAVTTARTASASTVVQNRGTQPGGTGGAAQTPPNPAHARPRVAMQAAVGIASTIEGDDVDMAQLGEALEAHRNVPGELITDELGFEHREGGQIVAGLPGFDAMRTAGVDLPESLTKRMGAERADELIRETQQAFRAEQIARHRGETVDVSMARIASICDPLEPIREIPSAFTDQEVVSPTFPSRPVGRGGYTFTKSMELVDLAGASRVWLEADQNAVNPADSATWKPIVDVNCGTPQDAIVEAVTYGIRYDNTTEMSSPERVADAMAALQAVRARVKEGRILQKLDLTLGAYTMESDFGAIAAFIDMVNSLVPTLQYENRLEEPSLTLLVPRPLVAALSIDRAKKAFNDDFGPPDVLQQLRTSLWGVTRVEVTLDAARGGLEPGYPPQPARKPGLAPIPVPDVDDTYRVRLYDASGYFYGETGQQNVGVLRDSATVRQNKTVFFGEEYHLLDKNGPQPGARIDVNICASGQRAGNLTAVGCNPGT